jgi:LAO/AO transport system kinase
VPGDLFRPAIADLIPYEPGKPVEEVQRELGLERVVKLASNEGQFGPFPAALAALERGLPQLNRYPDGGAYRLVMRLAERHGVEPSNVAVAAGADAIIAYLSLATLDPGDEVVFGWPSFASYPLAALKMGATPVKVALTDHRYDTERILAAITGRTKIVYLCNPNNPTGTMIGRDAVDSYFARVPDHVLTVLDEAYFEYLQEPDYPDGIEEHFKAGRRVLVLRTFSKIYGLAGLRLRDRPEGRRRRDQEGAERLRHHAAGPGRRRGEPRRPGRARASTPDDRRVPRAPRGALHRARAHDRDARGGELRLRRGRRGRAARLRRAPARGRDRPPAGPVRCAGSDPGHRRPTRGERALRGGDAPRRRAGGEQLVAGGWTLETLADGVRTGDRRALARAITLVESSDPLAYELVKELYGETGNAYAIGVTGPPGVGKSSLISALVKRVRGDEKSVGVISVDPSSPFTTGALLGDRIRLADHFLDPEVFIRSMGTRGHLGGLAEATLQAALLLDAAGKELVFLETVGAGQSEVEVITIADTVLLVLMPGSGDSIQALKAGIMEIPDVIAVNKRDHPAAKTMLNEVRSILALDTERDWKPPIVLTEAVQGEGIDELWGKIEEHRAYLEDSGTLAERRARNLAGEVFAVASARAKTRLQEAVAEDEELRRLLGEVQRRELDPLTAVREIMERVFKVRDDGTDPR